MPTSTDWPFAEPKNVAVFTSQQIVRSGDPILHVTQDAEDGAWQFLGREGALGHDAMVLALSEILELDPTIAQIADLPLGWEANRDSIENPWKRSPKK